MIALTGGANRVATCIRDLSVLYFVFEDHAVAFWIPLDESMIFFGFIFLDYMVSV